MKHVFIGLTAVVLLAAVALHGTALAHYTGDTESSGCQHDWADGTGEHHCH